MKADIKLQEIQGNIPLSQILKEMRDCNGWKFLKDKILKAQSQSTHVRKENGRCLRKLG